MTCKMSGQTAHVTGEVFDASDGQSIVGATVKVDDSNKITVTDIDGRFSFSNLTASEKKLTVSYVGYGTVTVDIKPNMKIYLEPKAEMMDEVIVVAFGKQKREAFTGSASVVSGDEISMSQVSSPIDALSGRVSGMMMTDNNNPAASSTASQIVIRGIGSINAGTSPLIVLDGLPYSGRMNDINPSDIENITVLKDAASNALYGARGANGVIMITTKSATRGTTKVTVGAKWGVNSDARVHYDYIDEPGEYYEAFYMGLMNNYRYKQGMSFQESHILANNTLAKPADENGLGYMVYSVPNNEFLIGENGKLNPNASLGNRVAYNNQIYTIYPDDWTKEGTRDGLRQEYNLSISGGSDKYTFMGTLGYLNNEGISKGSSMERTSARIKTTYNPFSFLRVGANASYTHTISNNQYSVFDALYTVAPIYPLYIRDGAGNIMYDAHGKRFDYGYKDVGLERDADKNGNMIQDDLLDLYKTSVNAFSTQGYATFDFLKYFHLTVNGSVYITERRLTSATNPYYGWNVSLGGSSEINHYRSTDINYQQLLNYNRSFGAHSIDLLAGHEYTREEDTRVGGRKSKLADYAQNTELASGIILEMATSTRSLYNVEGYFLRGQYDYDNKYFANFSYRRDGSSRFAPEHRWGNFWSAGAAWILTKEDWFPQSHLVNMLKFKASYGEQGNDAIGSYRYVDTYTIKNSNDEISFSFDDKGNPDITWEKVGNFNTGFEFEFFNSRLNGGIEYYYRKTSDMLMYFTAPYEMGYAGYYDNVGDMVNQGLEMELSADLIANRNFRWNVGLNLTWEKNRVTYIPEETASSDIEGHHGYIDGSNFVGEGLPMYTWYIKRFAGVGENGEALYYKKDSEGNISTTEYYDEASYFIGETALPKVFGGFTTSFNIFDFDINAQFNYSIGGKKADYGYMYLMTAPITGSTGAGLHRDVFDSWTPDNPDSSQPMWYFDDSYSGSFTDRWLVDGSYLTFKSLSVGYTLPKKIAKNLRLSKFRVYGACENVAYWTKRKGFDPRGSFSSGSYGAYSPMRTISGGIQVEF